MQNYSLLSSGLQPYLLQWGLVPTTLRRNFTTSFPSLFLSWVSFLIPRVSFILSYFLILKLTLKLSCSNYYVASGTCRHNWYRNRKTDMTGSSLGHFIVFMRARSPIKNGNETLQLDLKNYILAPNHIINKKSLFKKFQSLPNLLPLHNVNFHIHSYVVEAGC